MAKKPPTVMFKGRYLGIAVLVVVQALIGLIHAAFGFWLLASSTSRVAGITSFGPYIYSIYTVIFGFLTLFLAVGLWQRKRWSWIGTTAVLTFVIFADSLTLLNLPSIPGIPKFAGYGEISYSILIILYLMQTHIKNAYKIGSK